MTTETYVMYQGHLGTITVYKRGASTLPRMAGAKWQSTPNWNGRIAPYSFLTSNISDMEQFLRSAGFPARGVETLKQVTERGSDGDEFVYDHGWHKLNDDGTFAD